MTIKWGRYPPYYSLIGPVAGLIAIICTPVYATRVIIFCCIIFSLLLFFLHFVIETKNYFIFCYSLVFIPVKKDGGTLIKANLNRPLCDNYAYYIGEHHAMHLFLFGEGEYRERIATKKVNKDKFSYTNFLREVRKNGISAHIVPEKCFSKIGGKPNVPSDFVWPTCVSEIADAEQKTMPLSFLMQVDLSEISQFDKDNLLPKTGVLSVFYDNLTHPYNSSQGKNGLKIYYFDAKKDDLLPRECDFVKDEGGSEGDWLLAERYLDFVSTEQLPSVFEAPVIAGNELPNYASQAEAIVYFEDELAYCTQLLGYARDVQSSSLLNVVPEGGNLQDYVLLMMIDSTPEGLDAADGAEDFCLGTMSRLCVYIKKEDLANKNFDKILFDAQLG